MLQQPDQLVACRRGLFPVLELVRDLLLLRAEVGRRPQHRGGGAAHYHVVDEDDAMAGGDRAYFVHAVRVEGGECELRGLVGMQVDDRFSLTVPDDQLAAGARHRQGHHQRGDHAVHLLGVPMRGEESSRFVHQQLVQLPGGVLGRAAESRCRQSDHLCQRIPPRAAGDAHLRRIDLPAGTYGTVHQGLLTPAVGRRLRHRGQRTRLPLGDREGECLRPFHLNARHRHQQPVLHPVLSGPVDAPQQHFQRLLPLVVGDPQALHDSVSPSAAAYLPAAATPGSEITLSF